MAQVFAPPISPPTWTEYEVDGRFSAAKMTEVDGRYIAAVAKWLTDNGYRHKLTGKVIRFPVADGYAQYMIMNGSKLIHLPLMDAYQIPDAHARGLRASDLAAMVQWDAIIADVAS